ncbi:aldose 1-epimerase [Kaistia hirudinis]|uniref:aldose 1-epimerase n=1 Tax=Kaistia hirudinis TaxID=1293440 RepID=UPI0016179F64|nr:aldose 1-epimerase [Kaistia hirudinis]
MAVTSEPNLVTLKAGELSLGLVPEIGGSIAHFRWRGIDLMRPLSPGAAARRDVLAVASFPMVPYANRIDGNRFAFAGRDYVVQTNNSPERFNVHGTGWKSAWTLAAQDGGLAELTLDHHGGDDPYDYRATQIFRLAPEGLVLETTIENTGAEAMPFGFGHHPWFEREEGVTLAFTASAFWLEAPDGVAGDRISLPPELDFTAGAPLPPGWRNNNYGGWDGIAEISWPRRGAGLRMAADPIFGNLMLYADPAKDFFCLEPQTNVPCAFNKAERGERDLGIIVLEPGDRIGGTICFTPFAV